MATLPTYRLYIKSTAEYAAVWLENAFSEEADYQQLERQDSEHRAVFHPLLRNWHIKDKPATFRTLDFAGSVFNAQTGERQYNHELLVSIEFVTLTDGQTEVSIQEWHAWPLVAALAQEARDHLALRWPTDASAPSSGWAELPDGLQSKMRDMLLLWQQNRTAREIGAELGMEPATVTNYISDFRRALGTEIVPTDRQRRAARKVPI